MRVATPVLAHRVEAALRAVLPESVDVELSSGSDSPANRFDVLVRGRSLRVAWVSPVWVSTVEKALAEPDPPDIVVGDRVSPASRIALAEAGVGWVETGGAAEIDTEFLVVSRSGRSPSGTERRDRWTSAVLGTAEAVLAGVKPTVSATHEATGLSIGACTKALRFLTDLGLLEAEAARGRGSARRVLDQDALLDAYVAAAHEIELSRRISVGVMWRDPIDGLIETASRADDAGIPWVVTGLVAATLVAPHVTSIGTAEVYVPASSPAELQVAASAVGLRPIEGGRLTLAALPTPTTLRLASEVGGLKVAPWPRLVADLRKSGVRGEEAAEHVREILGGG